MSFACRRSSAGAPGAIGRLLLAAACAVCAARAFAAFGYTDTGATYAVDSGAGLVFQVDKTSGDITSVVFNGTEYKGPSGKGSQIGSGLGNAAVTADTDGSTYVKITVQTDAANPVVSNLTHYLVVRNGINTIYMATYVTAEPAVGELRWITRLAGSLIPDGPAPSATGGGTVIESKDVFALPDGTTRSKYYGDPLTRGKVRAMDLTYCGATGPGIGCWMVFGNRESSSGGPFYRDIENQLGGTVNTANQEIYNYMNSGHEQTEPPRLNVLHGPYALVFTTGAPPTLPVDFSWMDGLGLKGWVPESGRGAVSGTVSGVPAGFQAVVGFANSTAQYWAVAAPDGSYTCSGMKPGTYAATLYKGELAVATSAVTVAASATSALDLVSAEPAPTYIFRIGEWDGTPDGFLNGDKIVQMHPSDVRMGNWDPVTFIVGTSPTSAFPALQLRGKNSPTTISFNLAANQVTDLTLRIGITCAYAGGRPQVRVNGWTSPIPAASSQPNSRSFTVGTYRGNNAGFTYAIPASALVAGANTLTITPVSGSSDLSPWLSAGWVYDAVELDGPATAPAAPTGLATTVVSGDEIDLAWTPASGAPAYTVKRATAGGAYATIATGVTAATYADTGLSGGTTYTYVVSATNGGGASPESAPVTAMTQAPAPGKLLNLSVRATAGSGAQTLIAGFSQSGAHPILLRGVGPTLASFGVPNLLTDPALALYDQRGAAIASNDDWVDSATLVDTSNAVGAFPLDAGSKDAALLLPLGGGSYSAHLSGKTAAPGGALAEVYDADSAAAGGLINISARAEVSDSDTLIAGFVLSGNTRQRVLIRAVGPGLGSYGVDGVLSRPRLILRHGNTVLATSDDWSSQADAVEVAAVSHAVGAFPLADGSGDASMVVSLAGGTTYTVQVTSADGTAGVALVEVYAAP